MSNPAADPAPPRSTDAEPATRRPAPKARPHRPRADGLAAFATAVAASPGRLIAEAGCATRNLFQRDRDRIIHSTAFRRLTHKTQVFVYHEGDHYRTRLTHSLEVAQIARTLARLLGLDEDLAEAIALAHDLGHPPFGHAGERALDRVAAEHGGFDHNAQSLRVVTALERKYADFDGLNLAWETLEGLVKHNGPLAGPHAGQALPVAAEILAYDRRHPLKLAEFASLEAQVAAIADDIAYCNHDLDDGLRAGLIDIGMVREVDLVRDFVAELEVTHADLAGSRMIYEVNRRLITQMIADVVAESGRRLAEARPPGPEAVRRAGRPLVAFSEPMAERIGELRAFLFAHVYRHPRVMRRMGHAEIIVADLYGRYWGDWSALPETWRRAPEPSTPRERARRIVDFVSGMTDRYAVGEHQRLFDATPDLV